MKYLLYLFILIILALSVSAANIDCTGAGCGADTVCADTITASGYNFLIGDQSCGGGEGVTLGADSITFDCRGYSITSSTFEDPLIVSSSLSNIIIQNCVFDQSGGAFAGSCIDDAADSDITLINVSFGANCNAYSTNNDLNITQNVTVHVQDENGDPLSGVTVELFNQTPYNYSGTTDANGNFTVLVATSTISGGTETDYNFYIINASKSGYASNETNDTITNQENYTLTLYSASSSNPAPNVTLHLPEDAHQNTTAVSIDFYYNATDTTNEVSSCDLYINISNTWASQSASAFVASSSINSSLSYTFLTAGNYSWNVYCSDDQGNSSFAATNRSIEISESAGELSVTLDAPTTNISMEYHENYTFTATVTCSGGPCGTVNLTLDPYKKEPTVSLFKRFLTWIKGITGAAVGVPISTTVNDTPYYTTTDNPKECGSMTDTETCSENWQVNATEVGRTDDLFFAYVNSSTGLTAISNNITVNVTRATPNVTLTANDTSVLAGTSFEINGTVTTGLEASATIYNDTSALGSLNNIITIGTAGVYNFTLNVTQTENYTNGSDTVQVTVFDSAPNWSTIPTQTWNEGNDKTLDLSTYLNHTNSGSIDEVLNLSNPSGITITISGLNVTFDSGSTFTGTRTVSFRANDTDGNTADSNTFTLRVQDPNSGGGGGGGGSDDDDDTDDIPDDETDDDEPDDNDDDTGDPTDDDDDGTDDDGTDDDTDDTDDTLDDDYTEVFCPGDPDCDKYEEALEKMGLTSDKVKFVKKVTFNNETNTTEALLQIVPTEDLENFEYVQSIPKCMALLVHYIEFNEPPTEVLKEDPLVRWQFDVVEEGTVLDFGFSVLGEIPEDCYRFLSEVFYEDVEQKSPFNLAGIILGSISVVGIIGGAVYAAQNTKGLAVLKNNKLGDHLHRRKVKKIEKRLKKIE